MTSCVIFDTGTKEDEDKLRKLFSENGPLSNFYEVDEQQRNLLMEDFKSYLQKLKVMLQTGQYHSFLLFILSHGSKVGKCNLLYEERSINLLAISFRELDDITAAS